MGRRTLVACRVALTALGVGVCASSAPGQGAVVGRPGLSPSFKKIDAGTADTGPLNRSLRQMPESLRVDDGFQNVYEVAASPYGPVQYMRSAGGLYAVFPQSEYVDSRRGPRPVTPAGVVFWIGEPPMLAAAGAAAKAGGDGSGVSANAAEDRRVYSAVRIDAPGLGAGGTATASGTGLPLEAEPAGTMEDQSYRLSLLWRLAQQEKARLGIADAPAGEEPGG